MKLILASQSPRRRQLLTEAGYTFETMVPDSAVEASVAVGGAAAEFAMEQALRKAADVANSVTEGVLVACDTVVACEGQLLGKPADQDDARRMLRLLCGRQHQVVSGLCVWNIPGRKPDVRAAESILRMDHISQDEIDAYLQSRQWEGKAGAFGLQDRPGWIHLLKGSESNVVGLPLELLAEMLGEICGD